MRHFPLPNTSTAVALLVLFGLSAAAVAAPRGSPAPGTLAPLPNPGNLALKINCSITLVADPKGTSGGSIPGAPTSHAVMLTNAGVVPIPAGTKIHWVVMPRLEGDFTFAAALAPGKVVAAANIGQGGTPFQPCTAQLR
jgi:hypothetical protein